MVMVDECNWCKFCFEYDGIVVIIVLVVIWDGLFDDCNLVEVFIFDLYLCICKVEGCILFFYLFDGEVWKLIWYFGMLF